MSTKANDLRDRLDILEAERMVATIELRNALIREAQALLPEAIRQAKGTRRRQGREAKDGKKGVPPREAKPGSPALLRLITRLAMRPTQIDRPPTKR